MKSVTTRIFDHTMVLHDKITYRITKVDRRYDVYRIIDDIKIGSFMRKPLNVVDYFVNKDLVFNIAQDAIKQGKI